MRGSASVGYLSMKDDSAIAPASSLHWQTPAAVPPADSPALRGSSHPSLVWGSESPLSPSNRRFQPLGVISFLSCSENPIFLGTSAPSGGRP